MSKSSVPGSRSASSAIELLLINLGESIPALLISQGERGSPQ